VKIIALEEHVVLSDISAKLGAAAPTWSPDWIERLDELDGPRLESMDAAGIDVQVLSFVAHPIQGLEPSRSLALSREINDRLASAVAAHPDRFAAFATLPMSDPQTAAEELRRAIVDLGHVGAMIHGLTNGLFLDDPSFAPVLAQAQELGVPIYLHPAEPPPAVRQAYFSGLKPIVAEHLQRGGWGWHAELGLHVLRLAVSGTFERFPELQLIIGHMGEHLPFNLVRADERLSPATGLARSVAETIRDQVHITTSGYTTVPPLLCAMLVFGVDRILFSVDYPFSDNAEATAFLNSASISPADREKIAHGNWERLLKL
jgi:hypothetical protein